MSEQNARERYIEILKDVTALPTAPGAENAVSRWVMEFAEARALKVKADRWGNLLIHYRKGDEQERPAAFCAHMDHPGFRAGDRISANIISARFFGSVPREMLCEGEKVRFFSGDGWRHGVISKAPGEGRDETGGMSLSIRFDEGDYIEPGSPGMWDFPDHDFIPAYGETDAMHLYARGHDDLAGVASIACLIDNAVRSDADGEFYALFTRAEENGFLGAIGACRSETLPKRSVIVALETSKALVDAPVGGGAIVRVGDYTSIFTPWVTAWLWRAAQSLSNEIPLLKYQRKLMDGGTCETSVFTEWGYEAGGLCLPLGNYHNIGADRRKAEPEYIDPDDFVSLTALLTALAFKHPASEFGGMRDRFEKLFQNRQRMLDGEII